ncbi:MAG: transcriptional regulator [Microbacteriaceae bacterium]|nr:transcriptional regulator [Microbacteriaceae bacterium]
MPTSNIERTESARRGNRARGSETRQEILTAAIDLIARRGSRGVSLVEIADAAGVSKAGLLHHFPTKDALLNAALDVRDGLDPHVTPTYPAVGLEVFDDVEALVREWAQRPATLGLFTELLAENLNPDDPLHARLVTRAASVHENLRRGLEAGKDLGDVRLDTDVEVIAHAIIAFVNGLETYWQLDTRIPLLEIAGAWKRAMVLVVGTPEAIASRDLAP